MTRHIRYDDPSLDSRMGEEEDPTRVALDPTAPGERLDAATDHRGEAYVLNRLRARYASRLDAMTTAGITLRALIERDGELLAYERFDSEQRSGIAAQINGALEGPARSDEKDGSIASLRARERRAFGAENWLVKR